MDLSRILGLPLLATEHGKTVDDLIVYVHWLMLVLFIGWAAYFLYALFRFSGSRNPKADYAGVRGHYATYIEIAVAIIEGVLLFGFSVPLWARVVDRPPQTKDTLVLKISAHQFNWTVLFPGADGVIGKQDPRYVSAENKLGTDKNDPAAKDDFTVEGDFRLPLKRDVIIHISSQDVIHCFKVLPFRVTQDAIPGMSIPVWFKPTRLGNFQINCAQLCGNGHYSMRGTLSVVSQKDYDEWVAKKTTSAKTGGSYE